MNSYAIILDEGDLGYGKSGNSMSDFRSESRTHFLKADFVIFQSSVEGTPRKIIKNRYGRDSS